MVKCSGPNSSGVELGMVLVLPLIGWWDCDLTLWPCSFHKMSDPRDDPCGLLAHHPWLCHQLKGQHRQTKRGEEQTFKLMSIRRLIIFCFALLCFFHIAQWLFLVSSCCCFLPRTALFLLFDSTLWAATKHQEKKHLWKAALGRACA